MNFLKNGSWFRLVAAGLVLGLGLKANAATDSHKNTRYLGMGNAYSALVNDAESLFLNPAGLARVSGFQWTIIDINVGLNNYDEYQKVEGINSTNFPEKLSQLYGETQWVGASGKSALAIPNLAVAAYDDFDVTLALSTPSLPELKTSVINDYGLILGFAVPVVPSLFAFGFSFRRVVRTGNDVPIEIQTIGEFDDKKIKDMFERTGVGYAMNMGWNLTAPGPLSPTLSFAWTDVGNTHYKPANIAKPVPNTEQNMRLGGGLRWDSALLSVASGFDYSDLNNSTMQLPKKIHLGVELQFPLFNVRAGLNQGYYTLGAGVNFSLFRVEAATYAVELGEYPGQKEDRRYMVELALELNFDSNPSSEGSKSTSTDRWRRHLKVRR